MYMPNLLLTALFSCPHENTTFPITPIRPFRNAAPVLRDSREHTYVSCLDCGKEMPYDWDRMQRGVCHS